MAEPRVPDLASMIARDIQRGKSTLRPETTTGPTSRSNGRGRPEDQNTPQSLPEALRDLGAEGEPVATGFAPIDRQTRRGGLIPGTLMVVGGPPHTGKTTLVEQIGLSMSQKIPVVGLFADEGKRPAARRLALMLGITENILDSQPARAVALAEEAMLERSLKLWPTESDSANASDLIAWTVENYPGQHCLIILDSLQTIPLSSSDEPQSPRLAVKALISQCRRWAEQHHLTFLLTSQSNRASYRSKKTDDNSEAIASFAETSAIEFMADLALVLSLPNDSDIVDARLVKNRLKGSAKNFSIRFSTDTFSMLEADQAEIDAAQFNALTEKLLPYKTQILKTLAQYPDGLTQSQLNESLDGDTNLKRAALKDLTRQNTILAHPKPGKGGGYIYKLPTP